MRNEQKINFEFNGLKFKNISLRTYETSAGTTVYASMKGVSAVISQYIKQKYPGVKFQIKTDSFSMGDSVDVYLSPLHVSEEMYKTIQSDLDIFQSGKFNGMTDSYDYKTKAGINGYVNGSLVTFDTKFMNVNHRPKFGTKEYDLYESTLNLK